MKPTEIVKKKIDKNASIRVLEMKVAEMFENEGFEFSDITLKEEPGDLFGDTRIIKIQIRSDKRNVETCLIEGWPV